MKVGDLARIKRQDDPQSDRLYSGYIVQLLKVRPYSQLCYVTTEGVDLPQAVSFSVWVHASEIDILNPEDLGVAWTDSIRSKLIYDVRKR